MPRLRLTSISACRGLIYLLAGFAICEMIIVNISIVYIYQSARRQLDELIGTKPNEADNSFLDKLLRMPSVKNLVYTGKSGGFLSLIQNTVERVFIVTQNGNVTGVMGNNMQSVSFLGLDVSSAGEVLFIIRRIQARRDDFFKKYIPMVIDIGANDGLMSSNSFNLIQLGWHAILVEPQSSLIHKAQENVARYTDPYNEGSQRVTLVNAVLGPRDGMVDFVITQEDQESHILDTDREEGEKEPSHHQLVLKVPSYTVATFAHKYSVPTNFALLSIDAEGVGDEVLHQWLDGGFRPAYILYEQLHNKEPIVLTAHYMRKMGYRYMVRLGWNYVYEHTGHTT